MSTKLITIGLISVNLGIFGFFALKNNSPTSPSPESMTDNRSTADQKVNDDKVSVVASKLRIPWQVLFLPNTEILITERVGRIVIVSESSSEIIKVKNVKHTGEGGLLGAALHPNFSENKLIYLYFTLETEKGLENTVNRYVLENNAIINEEVILSGIKGSPNHDGGRIAFGPDGYLYVTTGDAQDPESAKDVNSLSGKILRITADGDFPKDNPYESALYSYGHRNPQGLAWDSDGTLWSTEHGPSGLSSGWDELNIIKSGKNYGWPIIKGSEQNSNMEIPIINSGADVAWAPAGAAYYDGSIFFGGLRGEALYEYNIIEKSLAEHFKGEYGRIRDVTVGPDSYIYFTTSNTDGRGSEFPDDDKLLKVDPKSL